MRLSGQRRALRFLPAETWLTVYRRRLVNFLIDESGAKVGMNRRFEAKNARSEAKNARLDVRPPIVAATKVKVKGLSTFDLEAKFEMN